MSEMNFGKGGSEWTPHTYMRVFVNGFNYSYYAP